MHSSIADLIDKKIYFCSFYVDSDIFYVLDEEFGTTSYGKEKYSEDQMFWIGYIY